MSFCVEVFLSNIRAFEQIAAGLYLENVASWIKCGKMKYIQSSISGRHARMMSIIAYMQIAFIQPFKFSHLIIKQN